MIENPLYLIVRTHKSGRVSVEASSNSREAIEDNYLYLLRVFEEEINSGDFRFDIYEG